MRKWWILFCIPAVVLVERIGLGSNLSLAWDHSATTNVAAYRIYYSTTPWVFINYTQVPGFSARTVVSGLMGNTIYYFAATTIDINGIESDLSEFMEAFVPERAGPNAPNLVAATSEEIPVQINLATP